MDMPVTEPFMIPAPGGARDVELSRKSTVSMEAFDASENIFTMIAHDATLLDVVEFFPKSTANQWKEKGWKKQGLWKFLADFEEAVKEVEEVGRG